MGPEFCFHYVPCQAVPIYGISVQSWAPSGVKNITMWDLFCHDGNRSNGGTKKSPVDMNPLDSRFKCLLVGLFFRICIKGLWWFTLYLFNKEMPLKTSKNNLLTETRIRLVATFLWMVGDCQYKETFETCIDYIYSLHHWPSEHHCFFEWPWQVIWE